MDYASERNFTYDKKEMSSIFRAFKAMDEEATKQANQVAGDLATYMVSKIKEAAPGSPLPRVATRIADGATIKKKNKIGEFSLGFARQKFSGGATTQFNYADKGGPGLLAGAEFGANQNKLRNFTKNGVKMQRVGFRQFPSRSPRFGQRGNKGYFIFPTLRAEQPAVIQQWEEAFSKIQKEWVK